MCLSHTASALNVPSKYSKTFTKYLEVLLYIYIFYTELQLYLRMPSRIKNAV